MRKILNSDRLTYLAISLIYLPGTILHEMSHYLTATVLMLKVKEVSILPEFENRHVRLGKVIYEKKDFIRSILVGISPLVFGFLFFWLTFTFKLFPTGSLIWNLIFGYLIFSVSSNMFSSRSDLLDLLYIFPLGIILAGVVYIFNIDLIGMLASYSGMLNSFLKIINLYLTIAVSINIGLILLLKTIRIFSR